MKRFMCYVGLNPVGGSSTAGGMAQVEKPRGGGIAVFEVGENGYSLEYRGCERLCVSGRSRNRLPDRAEPWGRIRRISQWIHPAVHCTLHPMEDSNISTDGTDARRTVSVRGRTARLCHPCTGDPRGRHPDRRRLHTGGKSGLYLFCTTWLT